MSWDILGRINLVFKNLLATRVYPHLLLCKHCAGLLHWNLRKASPLLRNLKRFTVEGEGGGWKKGKRRDGDILPISPLLVIGLAWILRMSILACSFGKGISIFLSSLPGRSNAGSSTSGRLVAMIILTCPNLSNPSIWFNSSMRVRWISLSADVPSENLRPPIASISSMKMMQGWWSRA